jgi:hypothetical protein
MTINGIYGSDIEAADVDEAIAKAERVPYCETVLDVTDHNGEPTLVVEE